MKIKLMTNRQLSEWLAKGNGELFYAFDCNIISNYWSYDDEKENYEVPDSVKIRYFGESEWKKPTADIYEINCKG